MRTIDTDRFTCGIRERAAFEAGIKLASLYHQFIGVPVAPESREDLERSMAKAMRMQPHVVSADVRIDREMLSDRSERMGYCSLNERMLGASVTVDVKGTVCRARMGWVEEMRYPLMWIEEIK